MRKTEVFFPFEPKPKGRPRFTRTGHAYTPKTTYDYEHQIRDYYKEQTDDYYDGPIKIRLIFYLPIPKSTSKKNRVLMESGEIKCIVHRDVDNLAKSILDACNGLAFEDDKLITYMSASKEYASDGNVGTYMEIMEDID